MLNWFKAHYNDPLSFNDSSSTTKSSALISNQLDDLSLTSQQKNIRTPNYHQNSNSYNNHSTRTPLHQANASYETSGPGSLESMPMPINSSYSSNSYVTSASAVGAGVFNENEKISNYYRFNFNYSYNSNYY